MCSSALDGGAQEIVLTGVHLGSWGQDFERPAQVVRPGRAICCARRICRACAFRRSNPGTWTSIFSRLWSDARLCRHLHLPLQSGSAETLRRMARKTTPESFARLVEAARAPAPDMAITTDVIVGFPGRDRS